MHINKIQILCYREGIDKVTKKKYLFHKKLPVEAASIISLFDNLDKIVDSIPKEERWNVHYTLANCTEYQEEKKNLREFAYQEAIAFDLDGIDLAYKDEYINIFFNTTGLDPHKTIQACSGNGLHFIVASTKRIGSVNELDSLRPYYKTICGEINAAIFNAGLKGNADPIVLSDKKTLRLPNTTNKKKDKPDTEAYIIQGHIEYQDFNMTNGIVIEETLKEVDTKNFLVDTQAVLDGCEFLKYCKANPNRITEPQWRSMITVLAKVPAAGNTLCHEYSKGYKNYDNEETEDKIAQIMGLTGPHKCKTIENVFSGCSGCKFYNKCSNPLQIKSETFIATQSTGFHHVKRDSKGILKPDKPCYEDLVKFFETTRPYVVNSRDRNIFTYNGKHWEHIQEIELETFATHNFKPTANNTMRSEFKGLVMSRNTVPPEFFEKSIFGKLNLLNGVLDISTRTLLPHSPEYGFVHVLPYEYNPKADCPIFDSAIKDITCKDEEIEQVLLEFIGYTLSGVDPSWGTKALILVGEGANGKSTFIEILRRLVGRGNYSTVPVKSFPDPNSVYGMVNKLLNVCEEESYDSLRDSTSFKNIVSGGETTIKQLYKERYTAKIMCKVVVGCNAIPPTNDQSNATYRRLLIVPFNAVFSSENRNLNKNIVNEVNSELPGILNRVLKALDSLIKTKEFTQARSSMNALAQYRKDNDILGSFFAESFTLDTKGKVYNLDVMAEFQDWRRANNIRVDYDMRLLSRRLATSYPYLIKGRDIRGRYLEGIRKTIASDF
jgi:P4 family phage/plasmid primase-like protien